MAERFTQKDLERACDDLAMMPFFPNEARASVMLLLVRMCPSKRALDWLVAECVNHVERWPGPAELRGLLCTRFDAADGIDGFCSLPGYSPAEMEARHLARHEQLMAGGWESTALEALALDTTKLKRLSAK